MSNQPTQEQIKRDSEAFKQGYDARINLTDAIATKKQIGNPFNVELNRDEYIAWFNGFCAASATLDKGVNQ